MHLPRCNVIRTKYVNLVEVLCRGDFAQRKPFTHFPHKIFSRKFLVFGVENKANKTSNRTEESTRGEQNSQFVWSRKGFSRNNCWARMKWLDWWDFPRSEHFLCMHSIDEIGYAFRDFTVSIMLGLGTSFTSFHCRHHAGCSPRLLCLLECNSRFGFDFTSVRTTPLTCVTFMRFQRVRIVVERIKYDGSESIFFSESQITWDYSDWIDSLVFPWRNQFIAARNLK